MNRTIEAITSVINSLENTPASRLFLTRLQEGNPTRDENPQTHFCVYFAAHDPITDELFLGHHKKSNLWIFNGGHMDKDETPNETVLREIWEEWGIVLAATQIGKPSLLTITEISSQKQPCQRHFDIWYFIPTSHSQFQPDPEKLAKETYQTAWLTIPEARLIVTDPANVEAINYLAKLSS